MQRFILAILFLFQYQCFSQSYDKSIDSLDIYINKKEFIPALNLARKKAKEYLKAKDYEKFCTITLKKSTIFFLLNDREKSFENLFDVLKVTDEHNLVQLKIQALQDIGLRYASILDYTKALDYYHKSISLAKRKNGSEINPFVYQRIYAVYFAMESDSALFYLEKVMKSTKLKGTDKDYAQSYNNYYAYYATQEKNELAKNTWILP